MKATIKVVIEDNYKEDDWLYATRKCDNIISNCIVEDKNTVIHGKVILLAIVNNRPYKIGYKYYHDIIKTYDSNYDNINGAEIEGYVEEVYITPKIGDNCILIDVNLYIKYTLPIHSMGVRLVEIKGNDFIFAHSRKEGVIKAKRHQFKNITNGDKRKEFKLFPIRYKV